MANIKFTNKTLAEEDSKYVYHEIRKIWDIMEKEIKERGFTDVTDQAELVGNAITACLPVNFVQIRSEDTSKSWHWRCREANIKALNGSKENCKECKKGLCELAHECSDKHECCKQCDFEIHMPDSGKNKGHIIGFKVKEQEENPFQNMMQQSMQMMDAMVKQMRWN